MEKNRKMVPYFRVATTSIEQKVWLYTSSKRQDQAELRDLNIETMKKIAQEKGLVVVGISTDSNRQLPPIERPGVQEMLTAVREGKAGVVMLPGLHHLSREMGTFLPIISELYKLKVQIHTKDDYVHSLPLLLKYPQKKKGGDAR